MKKIAFLLIGIKGYEVLKRALGNHQALIEFVVYGTDSGVDDDYHREIVSLCLCNEIGCFERMNSTAAIEKFDGYIIAIGWKWMLPAGDNVIIFHDSLLPKYRGFAPLVNYLINGESKIGATVLFAANDYDRGDIILQQALDISYPMKINQAIQLMSGIYVDLVGDVLDKIINKEAIKGKLQDDHIATYSLWRDEEDYWIDWGLCAEDIVRFVDAVGHPYSGARCFLNDIEVIVESVILIPDVIIEDRKSSIGKVLFIDDGKPVIVCSAGLLKIVKIFNKAGDSMLPLSKFRTRFSGKK
jgi:methionyl-tRNA formyltransferase